MLQEDDKRQETPRKHASDPPPDEQTEKTKDRCAGDRSDMAAHETADCAGLGLVEEYENEEDGGS